MRLKSVELEFELESMEREHDRARLMQWDHGAWSACSENFDRERRDWDMETFSVGYAP